MAAKKKETPVVSIALDELAKASNMTAGIKHKDGSQTFATPDGEITEVPATGQVVTATTETLVDESLVAALEETQEQFVQKQAILDVAAKLKATDTVPVRPELTDEEKAALNHCIDWVKHLVRNSRNVEFRQRSKDAIAALSRYL